MPTKQNAEALVRRTSSLATRQSTIRAQRANDAPLSPTQHFVSSKTLSWKRITSGYHLSIVSQQLLSWRQAIEPYLRHYSLLHPGGRGG
jgi:hypothetical protein